MKGALVLVLTWLSLVSLVKSYGGKGYDPLAKFIKTHSSKGSLINLENEDLEDDQYTPVYVGSQVGLKQANKVTSLPGQPLAGVNFEQYSGYVTIDPNAGRALFYYFAESQNPSTKPLVLWLNGGPGCSSLGAGAMTELGPFRVNKDGKTLWHNEFAWNSVANILFLESPAGVGFSYSNTSSDYITGDKKTGKDAYTFLINWLERFPEYKTRDFFISGESYSGHYVPQLAELILHNNKRTNQTVINLKGIAIGNAYVDRETQHQGILDYYWSHSLISDESYQGIVLNCNFSSGIKFSNTCIKYLEQADSGDIDPYAIYAPLCSSSSSSNAFPSISAFDPCSGNYAFSYLNNPEVQKMLHANTTGVLPGPWNLCNTYININWTDSPDTVLPTMKKLMASGIRIWIYSGDTDGVVPITTTRYAIKKLGVSVKTPWYPWYTQGEVGGYVEGYENLTFVSIRGAGHFVPSYQPARALVLLSSFLNGKLPPSSKEK